MQNGFNKVQKNIAREQTANIKISLDDQENNFLNFLTSKNIFINLQYSKDVLGIFLKQIFLVYSGNFTF